MTIYSIPASEHCEMACEETLKLIEQHELRVSAATALDSAIYCTIWSQASPQ